MATLKNTVLLVDDQPESIDVIKAALDQHFIIKVATRGELAIKIAASGNIDLILLDIVMPGMNGYEVCRQLKNKPATKAIPIIFLTSIDNPDDEASGLALGAFDFIRKPSSPMVVLTRVQNTIAHHQAKEDLREKNAQLQQALQVREDIERISQHDLKGPLSGILGVVEAFLDEDNLTEWHKNLLKMVERSSYTMLDMINRSLDLFKMENASYLLLPEKIDLLVILERVAGDLGKHAEPKKIALKIDTGNDPDSHVPFFIYGEKMLCYPLFYNLLLNAIEASCEDSHVSIILSIENGEGIIKITNSGEVPHAIRERFFEKYVTSGKKGGTGLGTYSAWLAVKTQEGKINLDTSKKGATAVVVSLPINERET